MDPPDGEQWKGFPLIRFSKKICRRCTVPCTGAQISIADWLIAQAMQFNAKAYLPCAASTTFLVVGDRPRFFCFKTKVFQVRLPNKYDQTIF